MSAERRPLTFRFWYRCSDSLLALVEPSFGIAFVKIKKKKRKERTGNREIKLQKELSLFFLLFGICILLGFKKEFFFGGKTCWHSRKSPINIHIPESHQSHLLLPKFSSAGKKQKQNKTVLWFRSDQDFLQQEEKFLLNGSQSGKSNQKRLDTLIAPNHTTGLENEV